MKHDTAGDPISGLKWTKRTTRKLVAELATLGIAVSKNTVGKLLKSLNFSLRVNHKKRSTGSSLDRDHQFTYIATLRDQFAANGNPVISVDTKKRELVGRFKNPGHAWRDRALRVNDHDFRSDAIGVAIPYGIYDERGNRGHVFVGTSYDTPAFAVDSIAAWWRLDGVRRYGGCTDLLILADAGGSNSATTRAWKDHLQTKLADRYGLSVTVSHYPTGASKWNPIEHRLFSEISKNWAGEPLESYERILKFIRTTKTNRGLRVRARLVRKQYEKGAQVSDVRMDELCLIRHDVLPKWNYTISPMGNGQ